MPASTTTSATTIDQDKVLAFISLLDEDVTEKLLRRIDPEVSSRVRESLRVSRGKRPSAKAQKQVVDEFDRFFRFARRFAGPEEREQDHAGHERLALHREQSDSEQPGSDDPAQELERINVVQLTSALSGEAPRTCALLMKMMSAERAAQVLAGMKAEHRDAIASELLKNPQAPPILLQQIVRATIARAAHLPTNRVDEPDPDQRVADVLRAADRRVRKGMLRSLQRQDAEMTNRIQRKLFRFEDLAGMDDQQIRSILGKVDTSTVSLALFGCDEAIMERILGNLSRRARETLQEELGFLTRVPESQQQKARETVCDAIAEVEMEAE